MASKARFVPVIVAAVLAAGCSGTPSITPSVPLAQNRVASTGRVPAVSFTQFFDLIHYQYYFATSLTSGPDKALWVLDNVDQDFGESSVVRIDADGKKTAAYFYPNQASPAFEDITEGPDGALWIADNADFQLLRMSTSGTFTGYTMNFSSPEAITSGPDKALWFTVIGSSWEIGRSTTGGEITLYSAGIPAKARLHDIAAGPDGALWFTQSNPAAIGRVTTAGKITEFTKGVSKGSAPWSIVPGPDGALWFTELNGPRIGRITTAGAVTEYSKGISPGEHPNDIAAGPDKALWFTESGRFNTDAKIGRIALDGTIAEYTGIPKSSHPAAIVQGPDGNMWFVEANLNALGRANL